MWTVWGIVRKTCESCGSVRNSKMTLSFDLVALFYRNLSNFDGWYLYVSNTIPVATSVPYWIFLVYPHPTARNNHHPSQSIVTIAYLHSSTYTLVILSCQHHHPPPPATPRQHPSCSSTRNEFGEMGMNEVIAIHSSNGHEWNYCMIP